MVGAAVAIEIGHAGPGLEMQPVICFFPKRELSFQCREGDSAREKLRLIHVSPATASLSRKARIMSGRRSCSAIASRRSSSIALKRLLRCEPLEPREMLAARVLAVGNYAPTLARSICVNNNAAVVGASAKLSVLGADDKGEANLKYTWSVMSAPTGGAATFSANGSNAAKNDTIIFNKTGNYGVAVRITDAGGLSVSAGATIKVVAQATSIIVTPNTATLAAGAVQQFSAQALDQFRQTLATQPGFTWTASGGAITSSGRFTAPTAASVYTISAKVGALAGTAKVTVAASRDSGSGGYQNAALGKLVQSLDADGSISRADMIQLLRSTGTDGTVDAGEFADLKTIVNQASTLGMADFVRVLASDVVNGNTANAKFQGQTLGNLAAGSSATQLNRLVDKWFLGADRPALCNTSLVYRSVSGSLFPTTPSHLDERQGALGDCYLISALGTLADSNPAAIRNMILDNGDGTFTVRFYTGAYGSIYNSADGSISAGFKSGPITADYVTVDRLLPTGSSGILAYAGYGASSTNANNSLWIPLIEKAYAQWNETGKEGRDGLNAYGSIQGGWMATVDAQVLGYNAIDYIMSSTGKQVAINALAAHKAVTIGTQQWSGTNLGLYASHAYAIVGYNSSSDTFTLYNPWGSDQPGPLKWSQLQSTCTQMAVADTTATAPINGTAVKAQAVRAFWSGGAASTENRLGANFLAAIQAADALAAAHCGQWSSAPSGTQHDGVLGQQDLHDLRVLCFLS